MHGDKKVIEKLNSALSSELTAIVQYMTQSEMCQNWGYKRLGERTRVRAIFLHRVNVIAAILRASVSRAIFGFMPFSSRAW